MTTAFRVTENTIAQRVLDNLQASLGTMQNLQDKLSSGKEIRKPSDDPFGTVAAMAYRADQRRTTQYSRNAQDGLGWLGMADNTLTSALESIQRVRALVLQGANGTSDAPSRAALAQEIKTAKEGLVGLANTSYGTRPIFAGTANPQGQVPPLPVYDENGNYNGNSGAVLRTVGPNASVQVNMDGPRVWGSPGVNDLWHILDDIQAHLTGPSATDQNKLTLGHIDPVNGAMKSDLERLDEATLNIQNRLSEIGARFHRVEQMQSRADDNLLNIQSGLSEVEDIDLPKTIVALQLQSVAYQTALAATAKVIQPSLVDFLR